MTMRLSIISLAGMARTLVAVGTSSDAYMFFTTAAAAPRSTCDLVAVGGGGVWPVSPSASGLAGCGLAGSARAWLGSARSSRVRLGLRGCGVSLGGRRCGAQAAGSAGCGGCRPRPSPALLGALPSSRQSCSVVGSGSSRRGTHANSGRPRRDPRGTCGTSPRPATRSVRMVKVNCSRQLLASIPSVRQASVRTLARRTPFSLRLPAYTPPKG